MIKCCYCGRCVAGILPHQIDIYIICLLFFKPKVRSQLLSHGLQLEEFGGDVQTVEISALNVSRLYFKQQMFHSCQVLGDSAFVHSLFISRWASLHREF